MPEYALCKTYYKSSSPSALSPSSSEGERSSGDTSVTSITSSCTEIEELDPQASAQSWKLWSCPGLVMMDDMENVSTGLVDAPRAIENVPSKSPLSKMIRKLKSAVACLT